MEGGNNALYVNTSVIIPLFTVLTPNAQKIWPVTLWLCLTGSGSLCSAVFSDLALPDESIMKHFHKYLIPFLLISYIKVFTLTWHFGALKNERISSFFSFLFHFNWPGWLAGWHTHTHTNSNIFYCQMCTTPEWISCVIIGSDNTAKNLLKIH